jgi:hypothetical protein
MHTAKQEQGNNIPVIPSLILWDISDHLLLLENITLLVPELVSVLLVGKGSLGLAVQQTNSGNAICCIPNSLHPHPTTPTRNSPLFSR